MAGERTVAERWWLLGGVVIVAVTALVGWFLLVKPELAKVSNAQDAASLAENSNLSLQQHVDALRSQANAMSTLTDQLRAAYTELPTTAGVDTFTRELSGFAQDSHVRLTSITISTPKPTVASTTGTPAASSAPPAGNQASGGTASTEAIIGHTYSIQVSIVSSGTTADERGFLHRIQAGPRAVLVTSAALAPPSTTRGHSANGAATLTIQLQIFVEPQSPQDQADLQKLLDAATSN